MATKLTSSLLCFLLIFVCSTISAENSLFCIPTIVACRVSWRILQKQYSCFRSAVYLSGCLVLGRSCWHILRRHHFRASTLAEIEALCICAAAQVGIIVLVEKGQAWLRDSSVSKIDAAWHIFHQCLFPISWYLMQEVLLHAGIHGFLSTTASLYPSIIFGTHMEAFLDALFAEVIARTLLSLFLADDEPETAGFRSYWPQVKSHFALAGYFCIALLALSCVHDFFSGRSPDVVKIGCIRPSDLSRTSSVLRELDQQLARGGNILVMPASASYISKVPAFIKYKEDIQRRTQNKVTVVVPTKNFESERACEMRMNLQIYPLGEARFLNSYTHDIVKDVNGTLRQHNFGSTFLTWNSRRMPPRHGSLSIATAICLDQEFPDIFAGDHSPGLVIIPNSAWSQAVETNRIRGLQSFAKRTRTAVLLCDDTIAGYVDPSGRTVLHHGSGSILINYNHKRHGKLPSWQSLWWIVLPLTVLLYRITTFLQNTKICKKSHSTALAA